MNSLATLLTIIITALGILAIVWKIAQVLNRLMDLPDKIENMTKEIRKINVRVVRLHWETSAWRKQHMRRDHNDTD